MAQILEFPKRYSNAYLNLSQLLSMTDDADVLEEYNQVMQMCNGQGHFLPGEYEDLAERLRIRRLDIARPEVKPEIQATAPGLYIYCPERGEQKPSCQIEALRSYYGKHYHLETPLELKGKGITADGILEEKNLGERSRYKVGWFRYTVTQRAFGKILEKYSVSQESLLD